MGISAITRPKGFNAAGVPCGIKKSGKKDLALIFSRIPALAFGLFTKNKVKAAPLIITARNLSNNRAQAIVANSGNANCYTGRSGISDAKKMAYLTAKAMGINSSDVLVASTGIIAKPMPMDKIIPGIKHLCLKVSKKGGIDAAQAIMTTDKVVKQAAASFKAGKAVISIGAIAKGAGMIFPQLEAFSKHATMFCFITTDANIELSALKESLYYAVNESFNRISIDACMSTNDMVLILANGQALNKKIKLNSKEFKLFKNSLTDICKILAKKIVVDAEGATKFIEIKIEGAKSAKLAKEAGFAVANSALFKTAVFGQNRNVGRVISALGAIGITLDEHKTKIKLSPLEKKNIFLEVDLAQGKHKSVVYTCDLSPEYVRINAGYS